MEIGRSSTRRPGRWVALGLVVSLLSPLLVGCGRNANSYSGQGPTEATRGSRDEYPGPAPSKPGLSRGQKVAILAGAAALYYLYNKHKRQQGQGREGQYYLSKNGRVYYRDRNGKPVWVTPPSGGIEVPADEAQQYSRYRGYNGQTTGENFGGYGAENIPVAGGAPGPGR